MSAIDFAPRACCLANPVAASTAVMYRRTPGDGIIIDE